MTSRQLHSLSRKEGRSTKTRVHRIQFILLTNGAQAGVIVTVILFGLTLPITPVQILWITMVTVVTLSLTLAFEPLEASRTAAINALVMGQVFYLLSVRNNTGTAWLWIVVVGLLVFPAVESEKSTGSPDQH